MSKMTHRMAALEARNSVAVQGEGGLPSRGGSLYIISTARERHMIPETIRIMLVDIISHALPPGLSEEKALPFHARVAREA
jgi:hypothetical protein